MKNLTNVMIDQENLSLELGKNLLEQLGHQLDIKQLCYHPLLKSSHHCRLCLVKDVESGKLIKTCETKVQEGMSLSLLDQDVIDNYEVHRSLLLSQHELVCSRCQQRNLCRLEDSLAIHEREWPNDYFNHLKKRKSEIVLLTDELRVNLSKCIDCDLCLHFENQFSQNSSLLRVGEELEVQGRIDHNMGINLVSLCPTGCFEHDAFVKEQADNTRQDLCRGCDRLCSIELERQGEKNLSLKPSQEAWICDNASLMLSSQSFEERKKDQDQVSLDLTRRLLFIVPYGLDDDHYHWIIKQLEVAKQAKWYLFSWSEREYDEGLLRKNRNINSDPLVKLKADFQSSRLMDLSSCDDVEIHLFAPPYLLDLKEWNEFMIEVRDLCNPLSLYHLSEKWRPEFYHDKMHSIASNATFSGHHYLGGPFDTQA